MTKADFYKNKIDEELRLKETWDYWLKCTPEFLDEIKSDISGMLPDSFNRKGEVVLSINSRSLLNLPGRTLRKLLDIDPNYVYTRFSTEFVFTKYEYIHRIKAESGELVLTYYNEEMDRRLKTRVRRLFRRVFKRS